MVFLQRKLEGYVVRGRKGEALLCGRVKDSLGISPVQSHGRDLKVNTIMISAKTHHSELAKPTTQKLSCTTETDVVLNENSG